MAYNNFQEDVVFGEEGERIITEYLEDNGLKLINTNKDYKYDIKMLKKNEEVKYEIKTDDKISVISDTGNHFVEFECRNRYTKKLQPSGISTSESDWYVFYYIHINEIWFIKTETLKNLVKNNNNNFKIWYEAGDKKNPTNGYLINRKDYKKYFHIRKI
jgi:hypothetical protein